MTPPKITVLATPPPTVALPAEAPPADPKAAPKPEDKAIEPPVPTAATATDPPATKQPPPPVVKLGSVGLRPIGSVSVPGLGFTMPPPVDDKAAATARLNASLRAAMKAADDRAFSGGSTPDTPSSFPAIPGQQFFGSNLAGTDGSLVFRGIFGLSDSGMPKIYKVEASAGVKTPIGGVGVKVELVDEKDPPAPKKVDPDKPDTKKDP